MAKNMKCRQAIIDRALILIPSATAEELAKIAEAISYLDKEDSINLMLKYIEDMKQKVKEEEDALI